MADIAIRASQTTAVPQTYTIPGAQEILPKTVSASMDGSGTAGAWFPCLQVLDPGGAVMFSAVPTTSIAAGASADVTWFPRLNVCPLPSTLFPNTNNNDAVLALGPWGYWKLNEAAGTVTVADSSGHGRSLTTTQPGTLLGKSGIVLTSGDTSGYQNGTGGSTAFGWIGAGGTQLWTPAVVSVVMWIQTNGRPGFQQCIFCQGTFVGATTRLFSCILNVTGQPIWQYQDNTGTLQTNTFAVGTIDGNRHMLSFVLDGTNVTMYLDGAQAAQQAQAAPMKASTTLLPAIGQPAGSAGDRSAVCYYEHVAWFDKVLASSDIATLYQAGTVLTP